MKLAGVEVPPGELIHAYKLGGCIIPLEVAPKLAEACAEVERMEKPLLEYCQAEDFDLEEYLRRCDDRGPRSANIGERRSPRSVRGERHRETSGCRP